MSDYILSIDQGTTGTTVLLIDQQLRIVAKENQEFKQHYPKPGWVEHDLNEIWDSTLKTIQRVLEKTKTKGTQIAAIGITNQRETTCLWNPKTGEPLFNAIVWQCRRTQDICAKLKDAGKEATFRKKTGLVLDPYFSGTKIKWFFDQHSDLYNKSSKGEVAFGTIDTFLVSKLTGQTTHVTDVSNASRTLLMNLETLTWDEELLEILKVPKEILPQIHSSSEVYGKTKGLKMIPDGIPIAGIAGDQQAALFGQACFEPGEAKCTYGTGSFLLLNTGSEIVHSKHQLLTTVAWKLKDRVTYALEGSAFIAGAAVQWLRDELQLIKTAPEIEALAKTVETSEGVVFVPALTGMGAPHWNAQARGIISGITRGTNRGHLARATLEGIAFQNYELLEAMENDTGTKLSSFKVDGAACQNNLLMQIQSDLLQTNVIRPKVIETTALGAACLSGLAIGFWKDQSDIKKAWQVEKEFHPEISAAEQQKHLQSWQRAIKKCLA